MSEPKWTPGPWQVLSNGETIKVIAQSDQSRLAHLTWLAGNLRRQRRRDYTEVRGTADLIAAAPELYDMIGKLVWAIHSDTREGQLAVALDAARLMAKARGEVE